MAANIKLKRSAVAGKQPLVADIDYGELALNYADGILYYKNNIDGIASISGGGADADSAAPTGAALRDGQLWWDATNGRLKIYYDDGADSAQWVDASPAGRGYTGSAGAITFSETAPANPSDGQIWYNSTTGKSYLYYENQSNRAWILFADPTVTDGDTGFTGSVGYVGSQGTISPRNISLLNPSGGEEITLLRTTNAISVSEVRAVIRGSSCEYAIKYDTDRSAAGTTIATETTTNTTTGSTPVISNASIPAGNYVWLEVVAVNSLTEISVNVTF